MRKEDRDEKDKEEQNRCDVAVDLLCASCVTAPWYEDRVRTHQRVLGWYRDAALAAETRG